MQHHADANPRADVGRAGRQIAELRAECVGELFLELSSSSLTASQTSSRAKAREHELDAEMVFLVDHDGDVFERADRHAARTVAGGELAGDHLPLDQELTVEGRKGVDVEIRRVRVWRVPCAELKWASISAFSPRLARLEKGKSARLRAAESDEHITMSLSGPVPRSHSPEVFVRSSRVMRGFLRAEQVSQPGGFFILFPRDRLAEPSAHLEPLHGSFATPGNLADVPGGTVKSLQQAREPLGKDRVITGTAQPAAGSEFHELDSAIRDRQFGQLAHKLADIGHNQILDDRVQCQVRRRVGGSYSPAFWPKPGTSGASAVDRLSARHVNRGLLWQR